MSAVPTEYCETFSVRKPMGARIHKSDCRITHIDTNSVLVGKAFVGDTIVALDGKAIHNVDELHRKLREPSEKVSVKVRHGMWSWCQHRCTTLERIQMDKDTEKVTGRPIDIYFVHNVDTSSIAGVHLRPGDIIREVNDKPVSSKTMLKYYILESIVKNKKVSQSYRVQAHTVSQGLSENKINERRRE
ncbi:unnamed protein product [Heligmosomoides polygyrus]|uniref:PDZ domain-containing protein n=1 Tax=Heligmosomoides polygyrus TaxID=6339 RepID=A0A183GDT3_HELPZ|nr:unnamed protein product [Heligmosomoides polygyrus]